MTPVLPLVHPSARLKMLETRAKRRFGQNFLADAHLVADIVDAASIVPGEPVTEIGPGLGILTQALVHAGAVVTAIEVDRDLAAALREILPEVTLVQGDALRQDYVGTAKVVANLPYNVATPLLMRLLAARVPTMVLMFQREVANRLLAEADEDPYGALSAQVQARAEVRRIRDLPPGAFHPAPKVWSTVVRFDLHPRPDFGGVDVALFDRVVRLGFCQRRKTLLNSLGSGLTRPVAAEVLAAAGIDPGRRAETVDLPGWRRLAAAVGARAVAVPVVEETNRDER